MRSDNGDFVFHSVPRGLPTLAAMGAAFSHMTDGPGRGDPGFAEVRQLAFTLLSGWSTMPLGGRITILEKTAEACRAGLIPWPKPYIRGLCEVDCLLLTPALWGVRLIGLRAWNVSNKRLDRVADRAARLIGSRLAPYNIPGDRPCALSDLRAAIDAVDRAAWQSSLGVVMVSPRLGLCGGYEHAS